MLRLSLTAEQRDRLLVLPVRDYYDDDRWSKAVRAGVEDLVGRSASVCMVGHKKDRTSYYLDDFPGWRSVPVERTLDIDATGLRRMYFESKSLGVTAMLLRQSVPAQVVDYLMDWACTPAYERMKEEHAAVLQYRLDWPAPWYMTADAIVTYGDYVALIRRKGVIGRGLWAIPGGFVNPHERAFNAGLRELEEEAGLRLMVMLAKSAVKGRALFDHPLRTPRGRIMSEATHYHFSDGPRPELVCGSDADAADWFHKSDLLGMESRMFEDHPVMLDQFLGVF